MKINKPQFLAAFLATEKFEPDLELKPKAEPTELKRFLDVTGYSSRDHFPASERCHEFWSVKVGDHLTFFTDYDPSDCLPEEEGLKTPLTVNDRKTAVCIALVNFESHGTMRIKFHSQPAERAVEIVRALGCDDVVPVQSGSTHWLECVEDHVNIFLEEGPCEDFPNSN